MRDFERLGDADLLALAGDEPDAFGVFYDRHFEPVLGYLARRTRDADLALDLAAEVFAAALKARGRYRPERAPARAWLLGIANKKLLASWRRERIERGARERLGVPPLDFSDAAIERVEELIALGESDYLARLADLSAAERIAIEARVLDEREYAEIAEAQKTSQAAIRQRVSRGLAKLAALARRE